MAWYATEDHPRGPSTEPCFELVGSMVYPSAAHPCRARSRRPWYQLRGGFAYTVEGHPDGPSSDPVFRIDGSCVYPASSDDVDSGTPAWFEVRLLPG
jgi:hypothetical protein